MAAFSDKDLERFFSSRKKDVEIGGAVWTLRELSGYQLQELQSMLLTTQKGEGAKFDAQQLAPHYAKAIAYSVIALDGEKGELTVDQVKRLPMAVFNELRDEIDKFNKVEEEESGKD